MSKKIGSPGNANTLFKYFAKSPATPKNTSLIKKDNENDEGTTKSVIKQGSEFIILI